MNEPIVLRVLIVEDQEDRQIVLRSLFREHAWVLTHTAERAAALVTAYEFDLVSLDFDLAGPGKGSGVAEALASSHNASTEVWIHSMNHPGAKRITDILPHASIVPFSQLTRSNAVIKRLRAALRQGAKVDWASVLRR